MDRMQVCGTCDLGSIPGESTNVKRLEKGLFTLVRGIERERGRENGSFPVAENSEALETEGFLRSASARVR